MWPSSQEYSIPSSVIQTLQKSLYHQWFSYDIKCLMSSAAAKELLSHTIWHVKLVRPPYLENKVIPFSAIQNSQLPVLTPLYIAYYLCTSKAPVGQEVD